MKEIALKNDFTSFYIVYSYYCSLICIETNAWS